MTKPFKSTHIREHTGTLLALKLYFQLFNNLSRTLYVVIIQYLCWSRYSINDQHGSHLMLNIHPSLFRSHHRSTRSGDIIHSAVSLTSWNLIPLMFLPG